ncbi:MAG: zf-HC2 domain-containing protein [bacterium]
MNCQGIKRNLVSYIYDDLSAWKRRRVERHLKQCLACRDLLEQTRSVRGMVADLPDTEVPEELARITLRKVASSTELARPVRRPLVLRPAFGFGVVLCVAVIAVLSQTEGFQPVVDKEEALTELGIAKSPDSAPARRGAGLPVAQDLTEDFHAVSQRERKMISAKSLDSSVSLNGSALPPQPERSLVSTAAQRRENLEAVGYAFCAKESGEGAAQAAFLKAMEVYNKAFQETGEARLALLRESLAPFMQVSASRQAGVWQVLASALCADIHRALGEIAPAVDFYQSVVNRSATYPDFAREARYALFKIRLRDQEDIDAARQEAVAIVDGGSPDARAGQVSLMMAERLSKDRPRAAAFWYRKAQGIFPSDSPEYDHATIALAELGDQIANENYVIDWWIIGPFDDPENQRIVTERPPEREIDLSKEYPGAGGTNVRWQRTTGAHSQFPHTIFARTGLQFDGKVDPSEHVSLYALTYVRAAEKTPATLLIGSDDSVRCWVNDEMVWSNPCIRGLAPDQDAVSATLQKGWNKILLKVANNRGVWGFFFQIVDRKGNLLWDLEFAPNAGEAYLATAPQVR